MNWFLTLAQTATQPAGPPPTTGPVQGPQWFQFFQSPMFMLALVLLVFYVFVIRSKRKQDSQRQSLLESLKKGDKVQTIGGVIGTVWEAKDNEVVIKVDESSNTKMRFVRSAIHRVIEEEKSQAK